MDPHFPFFPPKKYQKELFKNSINKVKQKKYQYKILFNKRILHKELNDIIDLYDAEIRYVDEKVNQILKKIKELGIISK